MEKTVSTDQPGFMSSLPSPRSPSSLLFSRSFCLSVGGITLSLSSDDPELELEVEGATKRFLVHHGDPEIDIRAGWGLLSKETFGKKLFDSGHLWQLYADENSFRYHFTSPALGLFPYKIASFDREFTSGRVLFHHPCFPGRKALYPLEYPLDELVFVNLLSMGKGANVHACGVVDSRGNGHLFVGPSGAGKTTMARLWQDEIGVTVLSDDRIILRNHEKNSWMYGTPWHGEAELASPDRVPLTRLYFLKKGSRNELVPLSKPDAAGYLFAYCFPPFYSPQGINFTLGFLLEVVESVPCYELWFVPDNKIVEFVESSL
jgi:hypothetical protein